MGFKKRLIGNIYMLNYLINRQINRRSERLVVFFVHLRAAFDSVDREVLIEAMKERVVREGSVRRCKEE